MTTARIGVFGGSGCNALIEGATEVSVTTRYGNPSAPIVVGELEGRPVAFLPRHGRRHEYPPHRIPYRANLWALRSIGVERVLAPAAAGSLQPHVRRGEFVVCDQLVDRTSGRAATFHDGPETVHVSLADPYCPELRDLALAGGRELGLPMRDGGTVVVIEGPRFSTRAESRWYAGAGWEVINMTQYPEAVLARELELCYLNVSLITDYDVGVEGVPAVSVEEVVKVFGENIARLRNLLAAIVPAVPAARSCPCSTALRGARVGR